ncbi:MAG TPA: hypothetical protein VF151_01095, partial [Gemmatimonadales bacterium]
MTLRDRLTGRKTNGSIPAVVPAEQMDGQAPAAVAPAPLPLPQGHGSSMYQRRNAEETSLNPVDQLKVELHRRLIERLDLEALEQIKDEGELTAQIRQAVF